jgi:hypothetical protein
MANVFFVCFAISCALNISSDMSDELATLANKIKDLEDKIEKLEQHIVKDDFAGTPYDDRAEAKAALKDLRKLLILNKEEKAHLQQQTGAGTSMLPVPLALVMFLLQRSSCKLANLVALECVWLHALSTRTAVACCCWTRLLHCALENQHAVQIITNTLTCISCCCCVVPGAAQGAGVQAGTLIS